jgi:MYXO-CTERM domain-containing protein
MKKTMQSSSNKTLRVLASGAGLAFVTGGVAEAGLAGDIYAESLNLTVTAPSFGAAKNLAFVLQTDFDFRIVSFSTDNNTGADNIFENPQPGDFVTQYGEAMGLNLRLRDWTNGTRISFVRAIRVNAEVLGNLALADDMEYWDWIGPGMPNHGTGAAAIARVLGTSYNVLDGNSGYLGFILKDGGWNPGAVYYYGWLYVSDIDLSAGNASITLSHYGIMTVAGVGIHAGDTGTTPSTPTGTPEPATTGLGLLALGAAGVLRHRRRREEKTA